ncbi:MAG TPA: NAD(P)H-binding protein [Anaerolineae bacterium]|nr:NAD(P)H-binding protein [Anaerolineae bacterium]
MAELQIVTGAFGYSGKYITRRLLDAGVHVRTLTNSLQRSNPFGDHVEAHPFNFDKQAALIESLRGATVLYNTYWIRFNTKEPGFQHSVAVENTLKLFDAAKQAGVPRVVHTSITNPSEDSPLEYFKGKAVLERALKESGLSYTILRPNVLFGHEDILINNIAWTLRKLPVFGVFGNGQYRLQPMHVDDFADLAVAQGKDLANRVIDAIGPETFTYRRLVEEIGSIIGVKRPIVSVPPAFGYAVGAVLGKLVGDVMITRDEVEGLMADLLVTQSPPAGSTRLTDWARQHAETLGKHYASELARRENRQAAYETL